MKKVFKNNYKLFILLAIIISVIIFVYVFFYSSHGVSKYGIRTVESEKYQMSNSDKNKLIKEAKELVGVEDTQILYDGKIIRIIITFNNTISITDIQKVFTTITDSIPKKYKSYYDISYFSIKVNGKTETYPVLGYKNAYEDIIIWESNE
ncbi:MAG TPA: hypothetical protein PKY25_01470 [Bacilli bacterium]|nr:hypothetical protein [Bacilli bacterium]